MSKEELILNGAPDAVNTYTVNMVCSNCGHENRKQIPLGTSIQEREPICNSCGCRTLVKKKTDYML